MSVVLKPWKSQKIGNTDELTKHLFFVTSPCVSLFRNAFNCFLSLDDYIGHMQSRGNKTEEQQTDKSPIGWTPSTLEAKLSAA